MTKRFEFFSGAVWLLVLLLICLWNSANLQQVSGSDFFQVAKCNKHCSRSGRQLQLISSCCWSRGYKPEKGYCRKGVQTFGGFLEFCLEQATCHINTCQAYFEAIEYLEYQENQLRAAAQNEQSTVINKSLHLRRVDSTVSGSVVINSEPGHGVTTSTNQPPQRGVPEDSLMTIVSPPAIPRRKVKKEVIDCPIAPNPPSPIDVTRVTSASAVAARLADRRRVHNALEKSRRTQMRAKLDVLKNILPSPTTHNGIRYGRVQTTSLTLEHSAKFIKLLEEKEKQLEMELEKLNQAKLEMEQKVAELMAELGLEELPTGEEFLREEEEEKEEEPTMSMEKDEDKIEEDENANIIPAVAEVETKPTVIQGNIIQPSRQSSVAPFTLGSSSLGVVTKQEHVTITPDISPFSNFCIRAAAAASSTATVMSSSSYCPIPVFSQPPPPPPEVQQFLDNQLNHQRGSLPPLGCFHAHSYNIPTYFSINNSFLTFTRATPPPLLVQFPMTNGFYNGLPFCSLSGGGGGCGGALMTSQMALNHGFQCCPTVAHHHGPPPIPPSILHAITTGGNCERHFSPPPPLQFCWIEAGKTVNS